MNAQHAPQAAVEPDEGRLYRTVDATFWTDPKILALPPTAKLFLVYLITNPHSHVSGIYYLPSLLAEHETGIAAPEINTLWDTLSASRLAFRDASLSIVWVRRMFFYQGRGEKNERAAAAQLGNLHGSNLIQGFLAEYPDVARHVGRYPIGRVSDFGTPDQDQEKEQKKEQEHTHHPERARAMAAKNGGNGQAIADEDAEAVFDAIVERYPPDGVHSLEAARHAWSQALPFLPAATVLFAALERCKSSDQWRKRRAIPDLVTWIEKKQWTGKLGSGPKSGEPDYKRL